MNIKKDLRKFEKKSTRKAGIQLLNTLIPIALLWYIHGYIYYNLSLWFWCLSSPVLVLWMTRLFIIFHDCGHLNWLPNPRQNILLGRIIGFLMFTPYEVWSYFHNLHHTTSGDLDKRTRLDIQTLTLAEYQALSPGGKRYYRVYRSAFVRYFLAVPLIFLIGFRLPHPIFSPKGVKSLMIHNVLYALVFFLIARYYSLPDFLVIILPVYFIFLGFGGFLFFIQHQFEDAYWERTENWDFNQASLAGSSFWDVGPVLHWFTGYIGYHHVHHLNMSIPNYNLVQAHQSIFSGEKNIRKIGLISSLSLTKFKLWDEENKKMVGFP